MWSLILWSVTLVTITMHSHCMKREGLRREKTGFRATLTETNCNLTSLPVASFTQIAIQLWCSDLSGLICVVVPELTTAVSPRPPPTSASFTLNAPICSTARIRSCRETLMTSTSSLAHSCSPAAPTESVDTAVCREDQVSASQEQIYLISNASCSSDAIMVAAHLLMMESGFISQVGELNSGEMPIGWKLPGGVYKLSYSHPVCNNRMVMVIGICMGPTLAITASLKVCETVDAVGTLCVNPCTYVIHQGQGNNTTVVLQDQTELFKAFRDQLILPLDTAVTEIASMPLVSLESLPPELLLRIVCLLDIQSVLRLSTVSRYLSSTTVDQMLWRHLYRRDFADPGSSISPDTNWKELYKQSYRSSINQEHAGHHSLLTPLLRDSRDIFPIPFALHPPIPGIIGGRYNLRPNLPCGLFPCPHYYPITTLPHYHDDYPVSVYEEWDWNIFDYD